MVFSNQEIGFSEVEEIMSVIEVAISHKDSVAQIRSSLAGSGYSKENIDLALKKMGLE